MPTPSHIIGSCWEDGGCSIMARVVGNAASNILQADISTITRSVYFGDTAVESGTSLTVADVVFDTLQTDARWTVDTTGYNFRDDLPATSFADSDRVHQVEYKFTPASGEVFWVVARVTILAIRQS